SRGASAAPLASTLRTGAFITSAPPTPRRRGNSSHSSATQRHALLCDAPQSSVARRFHKRIFHQPTNYHARPRLKPERVTSFDASGEFHGLINHLQEAHGLTPADYQATHGGFEAAPLWSQLGYEKLKQAVPKKKLPRARKTVSLASLFPDLGRREGR